MKKKIGLLVDNTLVSKRISDLVELSLSAKNYEVTSLIINDVENSPTNVFSKSVESIRERGFFAFFAKALFTVIGRLEKSIIARKKEYHQFYETFDLQKYNLETIRVSPQISKSGRVYHYSKSDLETIKREGVYIIVRAGGGILKGDILTVCPGGIISFHHADNDVNRGGPPGFWEVYKQIPRTGFIIQRLNEELDGGDVLYKGFIRTSWFFSLNKANLLLISNSFAHRVLEDLSSASPRLKVLPKIPYYDRVYKTPNIRQIILYILKTAGIIALKRLRTWSGRRRRWAVAYQFTDSWNDLVLRRSKKIANPKNRFLADPFLIKRDGKHYCFVEDFDYRKNRGSISVYQITNGGCTELGIALEEKFHLSYPYIFEFDGELFMCPETIAERDIRLYRCIEFPLKWEFYKTIIQDVSAADTVIFFHGQYWWLFSNIDASPVGEHYSQLHIFYASNPLSDEWIQHQGNPVIFDPLRARNGGLISDESGMYRVYQRHGFDVYGEAVGVAKITNLDPETYTEESLFEIEPKFFEDLTGTHTFNFQDGLLVFDFAKMLNKKVSGPL